MWYYDGDLQDNNDNKAISFLQVNGCGITSPGEESIYHLRRNGRCDYQIIYVYSGECRIIVGEKNEKLKEGELVIYFPGERQEYIVEANAKILWVHFTGDRIEEIINEARLYGGIHRLNYTLNAEKLMLQIISEHHSKLAITNEKGLLLSLIYTLGKAINEKNGGKSGIMHAVHFIAEHYNDEISIKALAKACSLSESRFVHLFKETTNLPPRLYQQEIRINNAKVLLSTTELSMSEIGERIGYNDPLYFSRIFKRRTGMSPTEFRKNTEKK